MTSMLSGLSFTDVAEIIRKLTVTHSLWTIHTDISDLYGCEGRPGYNNQVEDYGMAKLLIFLKFCNDSIQLARHKNTKKFKMGKSCCAIVQIAFTKNLSY